MGVMLQIKPGRLYHQSLKLANKLEGKGKAAQLLTTPKRGLPEDGS
jgi:hypothetical protein